MSADGFTEDSLNVQCLREDEICVPRFESCVFEASSVAVFSLWLLQSRAQFLLVPCSDANHG